MAPRGATLTLNVAADPSELIKQLERSAAAVQQFERKTVQSSQAGGASLNQIGGASRQIAFAVETIARQGQVTGEAMKQVLAQGSQIALTFGTAGPIVGALAVTGLAIYEHITARMKEAREESEKLVASVLKASEVARLGPGGSENQQLAEINKALAEARQALATAQAGKQVTAAGGMGGFSANANVRVVDQVEVDRARQRVDELTASAERLRAAVRDAGAASEKTFTDLQQSIKDTLTLAAAQRRAITASLFGHSASSLSRIPGVSAIGFEGTNFLPTSATAAVLANPANLGGVQFAAPNLGTPSVNVVAGALGRIGADNAHITAGEVRESANKLQGIRDATQQGFDIVANSIGNVLAGKLTSAFGGGQGANIGGNIGGSFGGALGSAAVAKALATGSGGFAGSLLGTAILPIGGTIIGSLLGAGIGSLFDHHKDAVDKSANALDKLTQSAQKATEAVYGLAEGFSVTRVRYQNTFLQGQGFVKDATKSIVSAACTNMSRGGSGLKRALPAGA